MMIHNPQTSRSRSGLRPARIAVIVQFFLQGVISATWVSRLPAIQAKLHLTTGVLGLALLGAAAGALVAMNVSGYLAARVGSRVVATVAALCFCAALPLLALAPTIPVLVAALVLSGASANSMDVAMNTQAVAVEQRYARPLLNSFHACWSLGGVAGSLVGGLAATFNVAPFPHFLVVALLCTLALLSITRFLLPTPTAAREQGAALAFPTRAMLALGLMAFCVVLGEGAMSDWSAIYLHGTLHTGAGFAAAGYGVFSAVMTVGRLGGDRLTTWLGPTTLVRLGGCIAALGMTLALLGFSVPLALLGFGCVGAGFSVVFPLAVSAAGRTTKMAASTAIAMVATCAYSGFLIGPPVIGLLAERLSLRVALGLVVVLSLCAALLARAIRRDHLGANDTQQETLESTAPAVRSTSSQP